jgi:hypothetical protein
LKENDMSETKKHHLTDKDKLALFDELVEELQHCTEALHKSFGGGNETEAELACDRYRNLLARATDA